MIKKKQIPHFKLPKIPKNYNKKVQIPLTVKIKI
jgi:hypothetical protein